MAVLDGKFRELNAAFSKLVGYQEHEFVKADIRDRKQMRDLLERHEIDALLHFAFVLNPIRDEAKMYGGSTLLR